MKTVLVVDNTPSGKHSIIDVLSTCGYRIIAAQSGAEAMNVLRNDISVDLVITEYMIPDMDGIALVSSVKTFFPGLPVILVTACSSIETYIKSLSMGVFEYLNKPVLPHELQRVVQAAMEKPRMDDAANF